MIFIINLTRGQMRFLTCVTLVTCLVELNREREIAGEKRESEREREGNSDIYSGKKYNVRPRESEGGRERSDI